MTKFNSKTSQFQYYIKCTGTRTELKHNGDENVLKSLRKVKVAMKIIKSNPQALNESNAIEQLITAIYKKELTELLGQILHLTQEQQNDII